MSETDDARTTGVTDADSGSASALVRATAGRTPDRVALVGPRSRLTWSELDRAVTGAALALLASPRDDRAQPEAGDRVALELGTGIDFVVLYLAILRAGLVVVPVNPSYTAPEVAHIVADSGAFLHLDADGARALLDRAPRDGADPERDRSGEALAALMYTSGTSGRGKGAMLSARALRANLDQLRAVEPALVSPHDVVFVPLPLSHIFGLNAGLGMALRVGATCVLADRFDASATLATMAGERVSVVVGVPGQFTAWLADPGMAQGFATVRFAMSGSAKLGRGVVDGFAAAGVTVHDGYGLTEAAPVVAINAVGPWTQDSVGSVGLPLPGIEVELRDAEGDVADDGDPGRIHVRGANLFSGYWPDGADGPDADGWFGTGDLAVADDGGRLRLVGRVSDLVIVNGFNVYPAEVEAVLADADGVAEVAVVGAQDAATGERVRAFVVPALDAVLSPEVLLAQAARSLARFKLPTSIEIVSSLPRTVTGKIMKWQLDRSDRDVDGRE